MTYVDPLVVLEITCTEITSAGTLRQPVLIRVRPDMMAHTVEVPDDLAAVLDRRSGHVRVAAGQRL